MLFFISDECVIEINDALARLEGEEPDGYCRGGRRGKRRDGFGTKDNKVDTECQREPLRELLVCPADGLVIESNHARQGDHSLPFAPSVDDPRGGRGGPRF